MVDVCGTEPCEVLEIDNIHVRSAIGCILIKLLHTSTHRCYTT